MPAPTTAAAGWLGVVRGTTDSTAPLPPATATATVVEPAATLLVTGADTSAGAFFPAERRGIRAWSPRVRWSVAISIVLLIAVVAGSVLIARSISANNLAAQELTAAVAELEAAESLAEEPEAVLATTVASYDDTVELARATADSAAPPLVAVAGMTAQPLLDASSAALAALVAQLDAASFEDPPEAYEREEIDLAEIAQVESATQTATDHAERVTTAIREVSAAQTALQEKLNALRIAQVTLGASLPETAVLIVGENRRALQSFRDAVIAAAAAVGAAQSVGRIGRRRTARLRRSRQRAARRPGARRQWHAADAADAACEPRAAADADHRPRAATRTRAGTGARAGPRRPTRRRRRPLRRVIAGRLARALASASMS